MRSLSEANIHLHSGVKDAVLRLVGATKAKAVLLFGSRARGDFNSDGDWDLCVVLPDDIEPGTFNAVTLWPLTAVDGESVQVYPVRTSVFEEKRHDVNSVSYDIAQDGVIVYGSL